MDVVFLTEKDGRNHGWAYGAPRTLLMTFANQKLFLPQEAMTQTEGYLSSLLSTSIRRLRQ